MTDDPKALARKLALRKLKSNPFVPLFGFVGLYIFPVNILTAIKTGHIEYAARYSRNFPVTYQNHPWAYVYTFAISVIAIPLCAGLLYTYYFKKMPDDPPQ